MLRDSYSLTLTSSLLKTAHLDSFPPSPFCLSSSCLSCGETQSRPHRLDVPSKVVGGEGGREGEAKSGQRKENSLFRSWLFSLYYKAWTSL